MNRRSLTSCKTQPPAHPARSLVAPRYQLKPKTAQDRGFVASLNTEAAEEVPALDSTRGFRVVCGSCRDYSRVPSTGLHKGSQGSHLIKGSRRVLLWAVGFRV